MNQANLWTHGGLKMNTFVSMNELLSTKMNIQGNKPKKLQTKMICLGNICSKEPFSKIKNPMMQTEHEESLKLFFWVQIFNLAAAVICQ